MKLWSISLFLIWISSVSAQTGAFYQLSSPNKQSIKQSTSISINSFIQYLSDYYDISDNLNLKLDDDVASLLNMQEINTEKPDLLVYINGIDNPLEFMDDIKFSINGDSKSFNNLNELVFDKFPVEIVGSVQKLTNELKLISTEKSQSTHFEYFSENLQRLWESITFQLTNHITDDSFKNDLGQLTHLATLSTSIQDKLIIKLNSLNSIGRKIGFNSKTYQTSKELIESQLINLSSIYNINIITTPYTLSSQHVSANSIFKRSSSSCYQTEQSCQVSTQNCNSHGICSKSTSKDCWSCACSPSFNTTSKQTTHWSGSTCSKKDVSVEVHLLFWTTVLLLSAVVGVIKVVGQMGGESLPGILDAATIAKKTN